MIIFLDIDGVLNNWNTFSMPDVEALDKGLITRETVNWDKNNVLAFSAILEKTNADVVISSTWRKMFPLTHFNKFFIVNDLPPCVIDHTPLRLNSSFRGGEINAWLDGREIPHVILDDDSDFFPGQPLIQTNGEIGLTLELAELAIRKLNA